MNRQFIGENENKKKLPILLEEFRQALEAEIDAIKKKASSSAVPLVNGKKIAESACQYQYVFTIDSVLNTPEGSPAELIVQGKPNMDAIIISVEELRITISVSTDLGDFVPFARLQSDLSILLKKLIERIENHSESENAVGMRMLGKGQVDGEPKLLSYSNESELNKNQITAVNSAIGRNLTYIWGPPGTGKTTTIGAIIKELFDRNRPVLLVSHTNTAVDQAIIKSAKKATKSDLENGCILRLGIPKNTELSENYPETTIEYQRAIRGKELNELFEDKTIQLRVLNNDIEKLSKKIAYYIWYSNYSTEKKDLNIALQQYENKTQNRELLKKKEERLKLEKSGLAPQIKLAKEYLQLKENYNVHIHDLDTINSNVKEAKNSIIKLIGDIGRYKSQLALYNRREEIKKELSQNISLSSQQQILKKAETDINELQIKISSKSSELAKVNERYSEASRLNAIRRALKGLPAPERLIQEISTHENVLNSFNEELKVKIIEYGKKSTTYQKLYDIESELKNLPIGSSKEIEMQYNRAIILTEELKQTIKTAPEKIKVLNDKLTEIQMNMYMFNEYFKDDPENKVYQFEVLENQITSIKKEHAVLTNEIRTIQQSIDKAIDKIKDISTQVDLQFTFVNYRDLVVNLDNFYSSLSNEYSDFNLTETQENIILLKDSTKELTAEINVIKAKLGEIDKQIIEEAKIIGTTLTKAYLSDELQARNFDTVILDEASMASIPALWATTLMSNNNVVIVGDFKQLPPIVLSDKEIAQKWIGCDIFEMSGVREMYENNCHPDYFVILDHQHRMEPIIADIANRYYGGVLKSPGSSIREKQKIEFEKWYYNILGTDSAVSLVDTESLNAWVTSVSKGNQSSRLNFLSATLCVNLAEQIVSKYIIEGNKLKESKVLIISPYRPHTKLIDLLLKDSKIEDDIVRAGTVHSFQGSEADVVIFDLVVDEPHFRVNLFMKTPQIMEQMRRLFNVAVTRAKFKLIIVGDFKYCRTKGRNSELANLLEYLISESEFPVIDAKVLAPALYEKSLRAQQIVVGGIIEPAHERLIVTQELFYKHFLNDLKDASNEVIIYSPFMTKDRLSYLLPQIQAAIERNVSVYIITKSLQERNNGEIALYREMEEHLSRIGATVIHKKGMHEKLVFIDNTIVWNGSLNPLSFSSTQEIMERRQNKDVQNDFRETLRLSELIKCVSSVESKCPICNSEMIAAEGSDEPYYWRCANEHCFTRSIDQKYPMNGELTCSNCGSEVEFGYWGEEPSWRCIPNKRHHQKLYRSHLKLPKMEKKIPRQEKTKVKVYLDTVYP